MKSDTAVKREAKPFKEWLDEQRNGGTHQELSDALNELVAAVVTHGKKGDLTFKIKMKSAGDGMVIVEDEITLNAPEADRAASIYFVDDEANLQRDNPRQEKLDLREVPGKDNVRTIS